MGTRVAQPRTKLARHEHYLLRRMPERFITAVKACLARILGRPPRCEQVRTLRRLVFGRGDTLLIARTGWGKSIIFHASSVLTRMITLQIIPLSKLGDEQLDDIRRLGDTRPVLLTKATKEKERDLFQRIRRNEFTHILLGPEQASSTAFRALLKEPDVQSNIGLVAIDECHTIRQLSTQVNLRLVPRSVHGTTTIRNALSRTRSNATKATLPKLPPHVVYTQVVNCTEYVRQNRATRAHRLQQIADGAGVGLGKESVRKILKSAGMTKVKRTTKPGLSQQQKDARLKWCLKHQNTTDWWRVCFSDETSVVLGQRRFADRVWRTNPQICRYDESETHDKARAQSAAEG